ncbi:hypothetical protein D3C81_1232020 [compost metagenome]
MHKNGVGHTVLNQIAGCIPSGRSQLTGQRRTAARFGHDRRIRAWHVVRRTQGKASGVLRLNDEHPVVSDAALVLSPRKGDAQVTAIAVIAHVTDLHVRWSGHGRAVGQRNRRRWIRQRISAIALPNGQYIGNVRLVFTDCSPINVSCTGRQVHDRIRSRRRQRRVIGRRDPLRCRQIKDGSIRGLHDHHAVLFNARFVRGFREADFQIPAVPVIPHIAG